MLSLCVEDAIFLMTKEINEAINEVVKVNNSARCLCFRHLVEIDCFFICVRNYSSSSEDILRIKFTFQDMFTRGRQK